MNSNDYKFSSSVKNNDILRASFNELTRNTFCFDFTDWYEKGHWGEMYIPNAMLDGDKVVSNISVNLMQFDLCGITKNYIQLGTVMTDTNYRGQGLNRRIMEHILKEYECKADGLYLFANNSVVNYYPKFGFRPIKEYEYYIPLSSSDVINPYKLEKVDMTQKEQCERLYSLIKSYPDNANSINENDGMYMSCNLGLYQFWFAAEFGDSIYYLPENNAYVVASVEGKVLHIHQIFGRQTVEITRLAKSFGENIEEAVLDYTPAHKENFLVREHRKDDCTLFILGDDLQRIEKDKMMFPVMSHA